MHFFITIIHDYKKYRFKVERLASTTTRDFYKVIARNKSLIFSNNAPILKAKNLWHWRPTWNIEGELWNVHFRKEIIKAIEKVINK